METLWQDIRYGFRSLRKTPGFTIVAILTLALGIGANSAIFSVVNGVLLKPLPYVEADRLMYAYRTQPPIGRGPVSPAAWLDFETQQQVFDVFAGYFGQSANISNDGGTERVAGQRVTGRFFELFGLKPLHGRFLQPSDDQPDSSPVVVLSHALWAERFGGDPAAVGRTLKINGETHVVIGVAPPQLNFPRSTTQLWTPAVLKAKSDDRGNNSILMVGRLKPDVSLEQAQTQMNQIANALAQQYPDNHAKLSVQIAPWLSEQVRDVRSILWILLGAVGLVLLIACANVANLQLVRSAARRREFAIRTALGAGRWRIIRQLATESLLLSAVGGVLGAAAAEAGAKALILLSPPSLPRLQEVVVDGRTLGFTALIALLTGLIFGFAPAWQSADVTLHRTLKEDARGQSRRGWVQRGLIVGETALALALMIGSSLLIATMQQLLAVNPGFETAHLLTADISYPRNRSEAEQDKLAGTNAGRIQIANETTDFLRALEEKVAALPGVQAVGVTNRLPLVGGGYNGDVSVAGQPKPKPGESPIAEFRTVSPAYFQAIGVPLLKGETFSGRETPQTPENILINESLARAFFPNEDPIGKTLQVLNDKPHEIIGVVGDAKQYGLNELSSPEIYFANRQSALGDSLTLVVRTQGEPSTLAPSVRRAVREVNADAPIFRIRTMTEVIASSVGSQSFTASLMAAFALSALFLSTIGLYGVVAYSVTQRTNEIGVRLALGAQVGDILRLVLAYGMKLATLGVCIGLAAAFGLTRLLEGLLFGVTPTDPFTFIAIPIVLIGITLFACWIPARRATKIDPMIALRQE
jgi:putative ABC transport system permease protein